MRKFEFHPLTSDRWPDLEKLFGPRGACGGCWCMWWRLARSEFTKQKGAGNRRAFHKIVESGAEPGISLTTTAGRWAGAPSRRASSTP